MAGRPKEFDPSDALDSAIDLFWSRGFEGCSMSQLVDEMEINRQSVYDTFGDKRALFVEALRTYMDRVGQEIGSVLTTGASPLGRVRSFLRRIAERTSSSDGRGCLLTNTIVEIGPHDDEIRDLVAGRMRLLEDKLAETLREAVAAKELSSSANPRQLARLVLAVMQGAIVLSKAKMTTSVGDALKAAEAVLAAS